MVKYKIYCDIDQKKFINQVVKSHKKHIIDKKNFRIEFDNLYFYFELGDKSYLIYYGLINKTNYNKNYHKEQHQILSFGGFIDWDELMKLINISKL